VEISYKSLRVSSVSDVSTECGVDGLEDKGLSNDAVNTV